MRITLVENFRDGTIQAWKASETIRDSPKLLGVLTTRTAEEQELYRRSVLSPDASLRNELVAQQLQTLLRALGHDVAAIEHLT